jgi:hypothetical protein
MTDRLTLTRAFESAGIESQAAERIANEIWNAIHENVATKQDLRETEQRLNARVDLVEERLGRQIDRMAVRLGAVAIIVAGLLFAALQRWPPH